MVTLYTKPNCVQCDATKRALDKTGAAYAIVDLTTDHEAMTLVQRLGYRQAPVVMANGEHWSGFQPDKIKQFAVPR
jgi:glutaredoxin-like protein NrdH